MFAINRQYDCLIIRDIVGTFRSGEQCSPFVVRDIRDSFVNDQSGVKELVAHNVRRYELTSVFCGAQCAPLRTVLVFLVANNVRRYDLINITVPVNSPVGLRLHR